MRIDWVEGVWFAHSIDGLDNPKSNGGTDFYSNFSFII